MSVAHAVASKAVELRLSTLMNALANVIARPEDKPLANIAAASVATPQRGVSRGRSIAGKMFEFEGAFQELGFSSHAAAVLL